MDILERALQMLQTHPLCDHCLGRQFALLGYGIENRQRGHALKFGLTLQASASLQSQEPSGLRNLKILATNGFSSEATETLHRLRKRTPKKPKQCYLCEDKLELLDKLAAKALVEIKHYEYNTFLTGVELPLRIEEREDELKAAFDNSFSESIRQEFGRSIGKKIETQTGKTVDFRKPDIVIIVNPFKGAVKLQVNPLFVAGRYKKLIRGIPQSKWFCSFCRSQGCEKCGGTGLLYPESVESLISEPFLEAAEGEKTSFHASGREDIDARMLGRGRPFIVEISKPRKRYLNLPELQKAINIAALNKIEISSLQFSSREVVRRLKKAETAKKDYRVLIEFESDFQEDSLQLLAEKLSNTAIKQQTPLRVMHRRADLTREKYIYEVKVKKVSPNRAEMQIRCQGGLYVKELVSGDEGRTVPSVSELLGVRAKPLELDVLNVIMDEYIEVKK